MKISKHLTKIKDFYNGNGLIGVTSKKLKSIIPNFFVIRAGASSFRPTSLVELGEKKKRTKGVQ